MLASFSLFQLTLQFVVHNILVTALITSGILEEFEKFAYTYNTFANIHRPFEI